MNGTTNVGSLTNFADRVSGLDNPWTRLPIVAIAALALWLGLLTLCGFLLRGLVPAVSAPAAIDARLIELPGAGSPPSGGASAASAQNLGSLPASTESAAAARSAARKYNTTRETRLQAKPDQTSRQTHKVRRRATVHHAGEDSPNTERAAATVPPIVSGQHPAAQATPQGTSAATRASASSVSTAGHNPGSGIGNGVGAAAGADRGSGGGGGSSARAIYAPVPSIPDDMRDEVMQATAVARFHVARDGSATVSLITPTAFASLDQLILDTLSRWRFQPAVRDGVAIEPEAEVRLRITVQ